MQKRKESSTKQYKKYINGQQQENGPGIESTKNIVHSKQQNQREKCCTDIKF